MIITILGIPRSGKTTLISQLVETMDYKSISLHKKNIMEEFAMTVFGKHDLELSIDEMDLLIGFLEKEVREYEKEYEYVFLDSHVGYLLEQGNWVEIRPQSFHQVGDAFIYLNTSADIILERMRKTQGIKDVYEYSRDEILFYQQKEWKRLNEVLKLVNKDCIMLNDAEHFNQDINKYLMKMRKGKNGKEKK